MDKIEDLTNDINEIKEKQKYNGRKNKKNLRNSI